MKYKKTIMLAMLLISLLSISAVSASENVTADTIGTDDASNDINLEDEDYDDYDDYDDDSDWNDNHYSDNFQPRIIPEEYSYRQNIPEQINYSTDYEDSFGYYISVVDEEGYNIPDLEVRLVDANTSKEVMAFVYEEDEDAYWCCVSLMGVGNHSCKIIVDDYYYNIKPIYFNLEIVKSDVEVILKETTVVKGDYAILKVKITDTEGSPIFDEGKVKFTVNGKNYYRNINENSYATLKVKMNKQGTITYSAKYMGDKNHNPSTTKKSKIHVLSTSKSARTIKIKGYKVVIPLDKYKKLINAKSNGKTYVYKLNTKKTIKQKVDIYNKKTWKKTTKTVKSKIYIYVAFDGSGKYAGSLPKNQYVAEITTSNQHRYGNIICKKWLFGYKQSKEFTKLNSAKVRQKLFGL